MKLTITHLIAAGMPNWDINKFKCLFPDGADITPENWNKAREFGLTPETLLAATATESIMKRRYSERINVDRELVRAIESEAKRKISDLEKAAEIAEAERMCNLLIEALGEKVGA